MKPVTAIIFAGVLLAAPALAQIAPPTAISVTGEATVSVPPDLAQIEGGVTTEAKTAREASESNNKAMGAVLLALKSAGIAEKDFQTSRLSLQPQYSQNRTGPSPIVGYHASNRVIVTLHDVTRVANIIDSLVAAGANNIGGINFMVSQASKLLDDARIQAIADAHRKAEIYANATNVTLGPPINISEDGATGPIPYSRMSAGVAASAPVAKGEETLRISVSVSYEIKPKTP